MEEIKVMTLDELEEMEEEVSVKLPEAEISVLKQKMKAMSAEEQAVVITSIKDEILWSEIKRRYFDTKDTIKRVYQALKG